MCRSEQEREFVRITKEECVCITENLFLLAVSVEIDTKWSVPQQKHKLTKLRTVYLPSLVARKSRCNRSKYWMREAGSTDYIKRRILDNKAAQTEIQEHCCIGQTEMHECPFRSLRTTLTDYSIIRSKVFKQWQKVISSVAQVLNARDHIFALLQGVCTSFVHT